MKGGKQNNTAYPKVPDRYLANKEVLKERHMSRNKELQSAKIKSNTAGTITSL